MPYVAQVAVGRRPRLQVFGNDYATPDGTGVRDYIHVCDLAQGHVAALRRLFSHAGSFTVNLGTGRGHSVLEVVAAYAAASGREIPSEVVPRRPGDVAECWADPTLADVLLGWRAQHDLARMCADSWRWQSNNPGIRGMNPVQVQPVIMAGGSGTRLWPLSRAGFPKQFLVLSGNTSLFQQAAARLQGLAGEGLPWRHRWWCATRNTASWCWTSCARAGPTPRPCCWSRWAAIPRRP